ncbi:MAG: protein-tyrosine phosphatase family protein [Myxococcota bacterium]
MPELFDWIDVDGRFRMGIIQRPPGGPSVDRAMQTLRLNGVDLLVSLQPPNEARACGLEREADAATLAGIDFLRFPITDHGVPTSTEDAIAFAQRVLQELEAGRSALLHCFAGIGRSGLMALSVMRLAGFGLEDAAARATEARRIRVPETQSQWSWLQESFPES